MDKNGLGWPLIFADGKKTKRRLIFIFVFCGSGRGGRVTKRVFLDYVPWARLSKRGFWNVD